VLYLLLFEKKKKRKKRRTKQNNQQGGFSPGQSCLIDWAMLGFSGLLGATKMF
jgi:hypothetical protein